MGDAHRLDRERQGRGDLRAARCGSARRTGRRRPPTSWPASISTASWARRSGRPASAQLVQRVVDTIADWGQKDGYFKTEAGRRKLPRRTGAPDADAEGLLQFAGLVQRGREGSARLRLVSTTSQAERVAKLESGVMRPQCSACFIISVKDSLESILDLAKTEGMLFKWGSGTGTNLSALREEDAVLSGGGRASGPLSFMKGFDAFAGVIKIRRQDAARGQDGDPQRGPSGHREVHLVQGQGREEGAHAGGCRLRFLARRRSLQLHLLPERQQLRARHRRIHGSGGGRRRLVDQVASAPASR